MFKKIIPKVDAKNTTRRRQNCGIGTQKGLPVEQRSSARTLVLRPQLISPDIWIDREIRLDNPTFTVGVALASDWQYERVDTFFCRGVKELVIPDNVVICHSVALDGTLVLAVFAVDTGQVIDALATCQGSLGARGKLFLAACFVA